MEANSLSPQTKISQSRQNVAKDPHVTYRFCFKGESRYRASGPSLESEHGLSHVISTSFFLLRP